MFKNGQHGQCFRRIIPEVFWLTNSKCTQKEYLPQTRYLNPPKWIISLAISTWMDLAILIKMSLKLYNVRKMAINYWFKFIIFEEQILSAMRC